jgi:hypothetical protein
MVWLEVKDDRAKRAKKRFVCLELRAPDDDCDCWYAVKPRLSSIEASAALDLHLATFYRISRHFLSKRDHGRGQVYFVTSEMYAYDVPRIEEYVARVEESRGRRRGRHAKSCLDHNHDGSCGARPRRANSRRGRGRAKPSNNWKLNGPKTKYTTCRPDVLPSASDADRGGATRQTFTEATINAMTTSRSVRAQLYAEHAAEIEAERAAGMFVAIGDEVA